MANRAVVPKSARVRPGESRDAGGGRRGGLGDNMARDCWSETFRNEAPMTACDLVWPPSIDQAVPGADVTQHAFP